MHGYNREKKFGLAIGDNAPDFALKEVDGESFSLEKALQNRSVVINFFRGHF